MRSSRLLAAAIPGLVSVLVSAHTNAAEPEAKPAGPVSYYKDVRPIFQQNCQGCHQPAKAQGGYIMVERADLLKSGDLEKPGVVPGMPKASFLLHEIVPG